jgi:hypothetical protein
MLAPSSTGRHVLLHSKRQSWLHRPSLWCAEDMKINEGDDYISETDIVVEEDLSEEETMEDSLEHREQAPPLEDEIVPVTI